MTMEVHVRASAKTERVKRLSESVYSVWVKEPAKENKANFAVIKALSEHFNRPQSSIKIIKGQKSKIKTIVF
jgi:uncharacterized protein (TIGR00251 family)